MFNFDLFMIIGLVGQGMFSMRFIVQWLTSEKAGKSVIPFSFWIFSLGGSFLLLLWFFPKLVERGYLPLSTQSIFLLNP